MTFISYAQNFEDIMLWRALKHVEKGFYIDIGAQDPVVDSVSLAFYEHGWRGVHVEPTQQYASKLQQARPDEVVEQIAIGDSSDESLFFFEFSDTGLSTADPDVAKRHEQAGYKSMRTEVLVISLDALLNKHGNQEVHWLKLDVEGLETSVLRSWRHSYVRPWVLVIESTRPLTQEQSHANWELMVVEKGYEYVYFDGLNRFYIHEKHKELLTAFASPPNIFDGFVLSGTASQPFYQLVAERGHQSEIRAKFAERQAQQASERTASAESQAQRAIEHAALSESQAQRAIERAALSESQAQQAIERAALSESQAQQAIERAALAESQAQQARERASLSEIQAVQASEHAVGLACALAAFHNSSSWRLTAPLRKASSMARASSQWPSIVRAMLRVIPGQLLAHSKLYVLRRPKLRNVVLVLLARFPTLKTRLKMASLNRFPKEATEPAISTELENVTPRARQIYIDLKDSYERQQKRNS